MFKDWVITEEKQKHQIQKIDIFDFDGTIFNSPSYTKALNIINRYNTKAIMNRIEEIKMVSKGDYPDAPQSLEPPVVPSPAPCALLNQQVAMEFYHSKRDPTRLTVVMTGRPPHLKKQVVRILNDFKMYPDRIYLMPVEGGTVNSKIQHIAKLLDEYSNVVEIEIWDDRGPTYAKLKGCPKSNHIGEFRKFLTIYKNKRQRREPAWDLKTKFNEIHTTDKYVLKELEQERQMKGK